MRVLVLVAVLASTPAAADDGRIDRAREAVLTDEYQRAFPGTETAPDTTTPAQGHSTLERIDDDGRDEGALGRLLQFLMWGAIAVGTVLAAFWLTAELAQFGRDDAKVAEDPAVAEVDLAVIERPLGDAEECARRGDYAEAIHTLLLRTLQELVRSSEVRTHPSHTSREILARVPLLADAREALAGLITAVELTHFGGDPATIEDYARCRGQFEKFAVAFRARGART